MHTLRSFLAALFLIAVVVPCAAAQESDLVVTKTGPDMAVAGSDVSCDVTVTNLGPDASASISLSDPIPPGMTFVSATPPGCTTPATGSGGTITCTIPTLAVSASVTFTFVFNIPPTTPAGTTFLNIATATSSTDSSEENNQGIQATSTPPAPTADMGVSKDAPGSSGPDTDIVFTIAVTNAGPDTATNVEVTDTLPGNLTFVSIADGGLSCTTPAVGSGGTITCTAASFPAGMATITITAHIPAATSSGTSYLNMVTVESDSDPNEENNEATTTTTVSSVDISVAKQGSPPNVNAGDNVTYTITVANAGPDTASITLHDAIPPSTSFVSFTQNSSPAASCNVLPPGSTTGEVLCSMTLAMGETAVFTFVVEAGNTTLITNTATISTPSFDDDPSNNSDAAQTTVTPVADVRVLKTGPATITAGTNATYTITVTNDGPSDASSVSLTDTLPPGMTLVSLTQAGGTPAFNCAVTTCTVATMPPDNTATFTLVAHLPSSSSSGLSLTNTANVSATTSDPDSSDNESMTTATSNTIADLSVNKSGPAGVSAGSNITYTVTIANGGPSDAANVSLTDAHPPGTTFVSATQDNGPTFTCMTPASGPIVCTIASFAAGASATFTFVLNVPISATGQVTNTSIAASSTTDNTPGNNTSSTTATIGPATDVSITKTVENTPVTARFTIVVTNIGPADALDTTVTDTLPAGTTLISASSTQGSCSGTSTVTCNIGTLTPGSSATITIIVSLQGTSFGTVSNTATVAITNPDTNPANNTATASFVFGGNAPALSPFALALLALMLAAAAIYVMRT